MLPLVNDKYLFFNLVTRTEYIAEKDILFLIEFLSRWKTYNQIEEEFGKTIGLQKLRNIIDKLTERKILITESDFYGDAFKENLIIVGLGKGYIFNPLSIEAYTIIKNCDKIICIHNEDFCNNVLRKINNNVVSLNSYFLDEELHGRNGYLKVAERFVETALKEKNIVYVADGNPFIGEAIPHLICNLARQRNLSVKVIAGQSSLDQMCIDSNLDPFAEGLVVVRPQHLKKPFIAVFQYL